MPLSNQSEFGHSVSQDRQQAFHKIVSEQYKSDHGNAYCHIFKLTLLLYWDSLVDSNVLPITVEWVAIPFHVSSCKC